MSALEWGPTDLGYAGSPAARRPHLVVLPGGSLRRVPVAPVRITRRGRLALLALAVAIVAIQIANQLSTAQISAGQELMIPRS